MVARARIWKVVLALLVLSVAVIVPGDWLPVDLPRATAAAQEPDSINAEDEQWIAETAERFCNDDMDCDEAAEYAGSLRDCLTFAYGVARLLRPMVHASCETHLHEHNGFSETAVRAAVDAGVTSAVADLRSQNVSEDLLSAFATRLRQCLTVRLGPSLFQMGGRECGVAYDPIDQAFSETAVQAYTATLIETGVADAVRRQTISYLQACLRQGFLLAGPRFGYAAIAEQCQQEVGITGRAPVLTELACAPTSVRARESISCTATLEPGQGSSDVTYQWSAPGGTPSAGDAGPTFQTAYDVDGVKSIEVTVCSSVRDAMGQAVGRACTFKASTVTVSGVAPTIDSISCTTPVATGAVVSCTAVVGGVSGATTRGWTAPGGDPGDGRGPSFTTTFAQPGSRLVTFETCNGSACASRSVAVEVRGDSGPVITSVGCPATVRTGEPLTCTPSITGMVTRRAWSAPAGTPAAGSGPTFQTRFTTPGNKVVSLEACSGMICTTVSQTVSVGCQQWDVSGTWQTEQSNNYHPSFTFRQSGTTISGTATLPASEQTRAGYTSPTGSVTGSLNGDQIDIVVTWTKSTGPLQGRYTGTIFDGRLSGSAGSGTTWSGTGPSRCTR